MLASPDVPVTIYTEAVAKKTYGGCMGKGVRVKREKPCEVSGKHGNGNASACT